MVQKRTKLFILGLLFLIPHALFSQDNLLAEMDGFGRSEIKRSGFVLNSSETIKISLNAFTPYYTSYARTPLNDAWILNSTTRERVWSLSEADVEDRDTPLTIYESEVDLEAGKYEVYYSTYLSHQRYYNGYNRRNAGNFFGMVFRDNDDYDLRRSDYRKLYLKIAGSGQKVDADRVDAWHDQFKQNAIFSTTRLRDDYVVEKYLKVNNPVELDMYAIGEMTRDGSYDFGWIVDVRTRDKVWEFNYRNSYSAGGAQKNRLNDEEVKLDKGEYKLVFSTDDSHSYRRWNDAPPSDPEFYGITVLAKNASDKNAVELLDKSEFEEKNMIVNIDRVGDDAYESFGFTVKKELDIHINALGEGSDGDMYDYAWIINAKTRKIVWEMEYFDTDYAGGAEKNRIVDEVISLKPGNYIVNYVTDDSHSYRDWNSSAPFNGRDWGVRLYAIDENFRSGDVVEYNVEDDETVIVRINRVGDDDRVKARFTIEKAQDVHVYAIGEGSDNRMYDYAWIEDYETGRIVWEMSYRRTDRAGGAYKNRLFDGTVHLDAGKYIVFYESDDSHSFGAWNDDAPRDPINWGITISKLEE